MGSDHENNLRIHSLKQVYKIVCLQFQTSLHFLQTKEYTYRDCVTEKKYKMDKNIFFLWAINYK